MEIVFLSFGHRLSEAQFSEENSSIYLGDENSASLTFRLSSPQVMRYFISFHPSTQQQCISDEIERTNRIS